MPSQLLPCISSIRRGRSLRESAKLIIPNLFSILFLLSLVSTLAGSSDVSPDDPGAIQAALDQFPGQVIQLRAAEYRIQQPIVIRHDGSGLAGPARLVQTNTKACIIEIRAADNVRVSNLTLLRPKEQARTGRSAIQATSSSDLSLEQVWVIDNRSQASVIRLEECHNSEVVRCRVENYMTIAVDDRTSSPNYGYAFNCIDGTGIAATNCRGLLLQANRVIERQMRPTRELMERHQLGQFVKRAATKGVLVNDSTWNAGYVNNWHQGSALVVTSPEKSDCIRISDNHVENAGQGIDIHADHVIVTGNLVINAFVGMKAMHGSRNVLIANNQFIRSDLWAIGLMPGAAAHGVLADSKSNTDGGSIIANNIISDFGHGDSAWIWEEHTRAPIRLDHGQEPDDPPLHDVLVTGNVIYDSDRSPESGEVLAGKRPGYNYAVFLSDAPTGPRRVRFSNNLLPAGTDGVANVPLSR